MAAFLRPEHTTIARALSMLRSDVLLACQCWFAGDTAIVMKNGEYRLSLDVDFICSSQPGYSALRQAVTSKGATGLFDGPIIALRDFRCDRYGLRTVLAVDGQAIKFEIVREDRIDASGAYDVDLACPLLSIEDQFAEKLLANADRGKDPSVCYRDAIDLGMLARGHGGRIPDAAMVKSVRAYGTDVWRDAKWVVDHLAARPSELERAAHVLQMDVDRADQAIAIVRAEVARLRPAGFEPS